VTYSKNNFYMKILFCVSMSICLVCEIIVESNSVLLCIIISIRVYIVYRYKLQSVLALVLF